MDDLWTSHIEEYILDIGTKCSKTADILEVEAQKCHKKYFIAETSLIILGVATIIFPIINIISNDEVAKKILNICIVITGAIITGINGFKKFGNYESRKEDALRIADEYNTLRYDIGLELSKPKESRKSAKLYQDYIYNKFINLRKQTPFIYEERSIEKSFIDPENISIDISKEESKKSSDKIIEFVSTTNKNNKINRSIRKKNELNITPDSEYEIYQLSRFKNDQMS